MGGEADDIDNGAAVMGQGASDIVYELQRDEHRLRSEACNMSIIPLFAVENSCD